MQWAFHHGLLGALQQGRCIFCRGLARKKGEQLRAAPVGLQVLRGMAVGEGGLDQRSLLLRCGRGRWYCQVIECQLQDIKIAQTARGDVLEGAVEQ